MAPPRTGWMGRALGRLSLGLSLLLGISASPVGAEPSASIVADAAAVTRSADSQNLRLGGYSGLVPADKSGQRFITVTDRGPNLDVGKGKEKIMLFSVPNYSPAIVHVELRDNQLVETNRLPLRLPPGYRDPRTGDASVTGLPNSSTADPPAYDASGRKRLGTDPYGLDTEGIAVDPRDGSYWLCEEYGPSILHVATDGTILLRLMPRGAGVDAPGQNVREMLPGELARRKPNHGFEGVAISPDGRHLFAIMQAPLSNPDKDTGESSRNIRLVTLNLAGSSPQVEGMYVYVAQPSEQVGAPRQQDIKVGDLAALSEDQLLVAERDSADGGGFKEIYRIDLSRATNILGRTDFGGRVLEQLDEQALSRQQISPVAKTPLLNVAELGWRLEKFEGLAIVDDHTIAVVDDNDFGIAAFEDGRPIDNNVRTRLAVIQLSTPLAP